MFRSLIKSAKVLQKIVEFKDFLRLFSGFPVLFKADLIFKDLSRKAPNFKYFSSLCQPWSAIGLNNDIKGTVKKSSPLFKNKIQELDTNCCS